MHVNQCDNQYDYVSLQLLIILNETHFSLMPNFKYQVSLQCIYTLV